MKNVSLAAVLVCAALTGCSPESPNKATAIIPPSPPPKILLPLYAEVSNCLAECISKWYRASENSAVISSDFELKLPNSFAELVAEPEEMSRFVAMIEQLPPPLHPIGKLGPDDEERVFTSNFGNFKQEKPKLSGELHNVISEKQRLIYVYSDVYYMRLRNQVSGRFHIAIDPETREYAGVLRRGDKLDEYHIVGSEALRSSLLAYTVANDIQTADMLRHYALKSPGLYESQPIIFPLNKSREAAIKRVEVLHDHLGKKTAAYLVPMPAHLQEARAVQAASTWYAASQRAGECVVSPMSPADRMDVIKSTGITPNVKETNSGGKIMAVEIAADDGRYETTWRFFKNKLDCERAINVTLSPKKYR